VNCENFGHTTRIKIFRLLKLLADLSTRLKGLDIDKANSPKKCSHWAYPNYRVMSIVDFDDFKYRAEAIVLSVFESVCVAANEHRIQESIIKIDINLIY